MSIAAVTGSASGIGAAVCERLSKQGFDVVGVDRHHAEVVADLSVEEGRTAAVSAVRERCGGRLDRLVTCAGLGTAVQPPSLVAAVNYFGAVDVLDGLLGCLREGEAPAAVAVVSNSAQMAPLDDHPFVQALLEHEEARARELVDEAGSVIAYMGSKHALGRALRRRVRAWGEAGVRLNGIAPGPVQTPLLQQTLDDPATRSFVENANLPLGRFGTPEEVAGVVAFLLGEETRWMHGSIVFFDGGNDADIRPERY